MMAAAVPMASNAFSFFRHWTAERLKMLALRAPREVPILLLVVLVLAVCLLILYTYIAINPNV